MTGAHTLILESVRVKYELTFFRNITVIQGDSATGKTTLVDMIQEYYLNGQDTGIQLRCDCPCRVIAGNTWKEQLNGIQNSLVFIDEGNRFVRSDEFARLIQHTNNYYVLVTRENLVNLPYSVTEIYGIRSSGKYEKQEPVYHSLYRIYGELKKTGDAPGRAVLVEDSNSGFEFFDYLAEARNVNCLSAGGAGNIFDMLQELDTEGGVAVIADGAAFGGQMGKVYKLIHRKAGIQLYLPESFEWLILSAGILKDNEIGRILEAPYEYIDSSRFFSWERYFTDFLISNTAGTYLQYSKKKLNPVYLQGKVRERIFSVLPEPLRKFFGGEL